MEVSLAHVIVAADVAFAVGLVGGWFAGRWYQRRRADGTAKEDIITAEKAKVVAFVMPYLQVLKRELEEIKAKLPK